MKPTMNVPADLLDNGDRFQSPFFQGFRLRHAERPIDLGQGIRKNYAFPTFYDQVSCAVTAFPCDYGQAARLVAERLHPAVKPVSLTRGRALIAFACYEYSQVMGLPPYNEVAVTIPIMVNARLRPPILPIVPGGFKKFGFYVAAMPVTSHENTLRGQRIWGLPKETLEVAIRREGAGSETAVRAPDGALWFRVRGRTDGKPRRFDVRAQIYGKLDGRVIAAESCFAGAFNVVQDIGALVGFRRPRPARPWLELGSAPGAAFLHELGIEPQPVICRFCDSMSSVFDLPPVEQPSWLATLNHS